MLLVLDNCEHIVAPVAELCRHLLATCPDLTVLATSRELLGIDGEVLYRVPSLEIPEPGVEATASLECDAVRLFVERARLVNATFEIGASNVDDVVEICRHLDGIPLAIELAAARISVLSPAQIAARLDERFKLLVGVTRGRSQRQQTLLAAIEWGHDLLDERERIAFRRLSWFVSDFSLEAAEHVVAGGPVDELDAVDLLRALVDKSMVTPVHGQEGITRFQLLESIREYGAGHLAASGERADVGRRHVEWCTGLAETLQARQRRGDLAGALVHLEEEEDNLRAALRFAIDSGHLLDAGRMVGALGYLWYAAGLHREGIQWCRELFDLEPVLPDEIRAGALHSYGTLLGSWTRPDLGVPLLTEQVAIRRRLGDPARLAAALNNLGNLQYDIGDFAAAQESLEAAIEEFRRAGETPTLALSSLAGGHLHVGDYERAAELYAEALDEAAMVDDAYGVALATAGLGQCAVRSGRATEARELLERARAGFVELKVSPGVADVDFNLALVARADGAVARAAEHLLSSLTTPGAHWYDDAQYWLVQVAASLVDEPATAAMLVAAAGARYAAAPVAQPAFVLDDLAATRRALEARQDPSELQRWFRAGERLAGPDAVERAIRSLREIRSRDELDRPA